MRGTRPETVLGKGGAKTRYIGLGAQPKDSSGQNPYVESFNGKIRDELLRREIFGNLLEAKVLSGKYRTHYNHERPHSALDYQPPAAFAAAYRSNQTDRINPEPAPALT